MNAMATLGALALIAIGCAVTVLLLLRDHARATRD